MNRQRAPGRSDAAAIAVIPKLRTWERELDAGIDWPAAAQVQRSVGDASVGSNSGESDPTQTRVARNQAGGPEPSSTVALWVLPLESVQSTRTWS